MAVTVGGVLESVSGLRLAGGASALANHVRWVHVSELEDPTPWLKGGELLLTTGMGVGGTQARQRAYLERLTSAGLAGLGLGTGFTYATVPKALRTVADRLGFPVFEVPFDVPFIAITEAVFTKLAAEQVDVFQRALETQTQLTNAVLKGDGLTGIVAGLGRAIGGWAAVLDLHGLAVAASRPSAADRAAALWGEVRASKPKVSGYSLSLVDRGHRVSVQPVAVAGRAEGVLVIGTREPLGHFERLVVNHAVSLLALEFDKTASVATAERRLKGDFLDALIGGTLAEEDETKGLRRFGFAPGQAVRVVAIDGSARTAERAWAVEDALSRRTEAFLVSPRDETLVVMLPEGIDVEGVRDEVAAKLSAPVVAGVGSPVPAEQAGRSLREALHALRICVAEGKRIADFSSLGTYRLLLTLQDPDALREFVDAVLQPLDLYDQQHRGELVESLRAFLEANARWEAAAAELFVHRHTLRYRMRKVEELTGRDLDSANDRMEFWMALRARELLVPSDELR